MFRMSLRELLIGVALLAVAIVSLKYASDTWLAIVAAITMLIFFVELIVAVVDRGPRQAFAIGCALTITAYALVLNTGQRTSGSSGSISSQNVELDHMRGRIPTTRLLRYVHAAVEDGTYVNVFTGKELPNRDPAKDPNRGSGGFGGLGTAVSYREIPPREIFMPVGHCWWALILGYAGGHFANNVYGRRLRDEQKLPVDTS